MTKLDLSQAVSILANLGVIGGIIFLGFELRQNNQLLEMEARATSLSQRTTAVQSAIDPEVGRLVTKASNGESLTIGEQLQLVAFYTLFIEIWEWGYTETQLGTLENAELSQVEIVFDVIPGFKEYWQSNRHSASPDFREWLDAQLAEE